MTLAKIFKVYELCKDAPIDGIHFSQMNKGGKEENFIQFFSGVFPKQAKKT
jgi:hypothetical protein